MRIIARRTLCEMARRHGDCQQRCEEWYHTARKATWRSLVDVRAVYPHADLIGDKTVFNIKGNDYRLITYINYRINTLFIKELLTHAEYDRGDWKQQ